MREWGNHTSFVALGLLAAVFAGCGDEERINPVETGGAGGAGGTAGLAPNGGTGGDAMGGTGGSEPVPDRGDPTTFPTDCIETCQEACETIVACGSEDSPVHPIDLDECVLRCGVAANGPLWDDVSGVFRCCATQDSCEDAAHCGGWINHPAPATACDTLCSCFFSSVVSGLAAGRTLPRGYRFAPDALFVHTPNGQRATAPIPGVRSVRPGPYSLVTLDEGESDRTLEALARIGRVLPAVVDGDGRIGAITGRIIVQTSSSRQSAMAAQRIGAAGGRLVKHRKEAAGMSVYEIDDAYTAIDLTAELSASGISAELDQARYYDKRSIPNDPLFADQWHLKNEGQRDSIISVDARVDEAWDTTTGDAQVVIAIHDDGVDLGHPEFAGRLLPEQNYPDDWEQQMANGTFAGHGTPVAGVAAAAADNNMEGAGACPDCTILPRLLGATVGPQFQVTDVEIADGFTELVDAGAWIISNSWGPSTGNPIYDDPGFGVAPLASVIAASFVYAENNGRGGLGTVILYAAGNSNDVLDSYSTYPTTMSIGAVSNVGLKSYYSSFGAGLSVSAPSNGGLAGITTTAAGGGNTDDFGGTSSACPLAAGVAGLVMAANPTLTAQEVRDLLAATATKIDPLWGEWDNGHSNFYGAGMINAAKAVQLAAGSCATPETCVAASDDCSVGGTCGTVTGCSSCRTDADCISGSVCQALPSVGRMVCVEPTPMGGCPMGTISQKGHCLPTMDSCALCQAMEECNGRDDDCDGVVDEDDACTGNARCFIDGLSCASDEVCAAISCVPKCADDSECGEGETCRAVKSQYGDLSIFKGCVASGLSQCQIGCQVIASTLDDQALGEFVTCGENAIGNCQAAFGCAALLPISM